MGRIALFHRGEEHLYKALILQIVSFFDSKTIFFTMLGYPMSYLEFFGVLAGLLAVWYSAKGKIISWPLGVVNVVLAFFLVYQVQLYPDMFLQIFFLITNLIGWWRWAHPQENEKDKKSELKISRMYPRQIIFFSCTGFAGTLLFGSIASHLHEWLPAVFGLPSAFPYIDSFVMVMSIVATYLMVQKKVECWAVWVLLDAVATAMYLVKGIKFFGVEYLVFCFLASYGFWNWLKEYRSYSVRQA
jgi:nicotinamide mononucleotide transporter